MKDLFIGNIFNPTKRGSLSKNVSEALDTKKRQQAFDWLKNYLQNDVMLGPARGTKTHTADKLREMGYIGLYEKTQAHLIDRSAIPTIDEIDTSIKLIPESDND